MQIALEGLKEKQESTVLKATSGHALLHSGTSVGLAEHLTKVMLTFNPWHGLTWLALF